MLFIQIFCIRYDKSQRSSEEMRKIHAVRFKEISEVKPDLAYGEICFCKENNTRNPAHPAKSVAYREQFPVSDRVRIHKQNETYQIMYTHRPAQQFFKPVFTLAEHQYGRIIYHERSTTFDGEWEYFRTVINFIYTDNSAYRPKLFFRKEPNFLFEDQNYLFYCGEYHKRRILNQTKSTDGKKGKQ